MNDASDSNSLAGETGSAPRRVNLDAYLAKPSPALREFGRLFNKKKAITIFDIGCCEGEDSIRFSRHFTASRVLAFEALPNNQRICRENLACYHATRIELIPVALCDRLGTSDFHVSSGAPNDGEKDWNYGNKSSSVLPPKNRESMLGWVEFTGKITVPCTTLDAFCQSRGITRIELVHMDVQGAESLVLVGAARLLPNIGAIWLEVSVKEFYAGQQLKDHLDGLLRGAGFWRLREFMRPDGEGDQFWLNRRHPRSWMRRVTAALGDAKYRLTCKARSRPR
jgi:FkbM family methyltransferase